jgi:hypothetical protein
VKYSIGEDGFRVTPVASTRDTQRINFLGDSFTFGEGLKDNETLPYFIHEAIKNISVKNLGFPATGVHQALAILESERDMTGAINFLLTSPWHAVRSSCKPIWTIGSPKYEIQSNGALVRVGRCFHRGEFSVLRKILTHSTLYSIAEKEWRSSISDSDLDLYLAIVRRIGEISHRRNQKFVIGFLKAEENFFKSTSYTNEKVFQQLKGWSDDIVDVTLAERIEDLDARYFIHQLDKHPSPLGNFKRAVMLAPILDQHLRTGEAQMPAQTLIKYKGH